MADSFVGTGVMVRLGLRRDRILLPAWILGLAVMAGGSAAATVSLYPEEKARVEAADVINATSSLVALYGRIYDPTSLGELSLIKLTAFGSAIIAVLMVVLVVRHSRGDEESDRVELLSGGRLGRLAPLAAAMIIGCGASLALGLMTAGALIAAGLPATGSLAFGAGWAATGMAFSAVAGLTSQVSTSARVSMGLAFVVIGVAFALRAVGDLAEPGPSFLSWLSPIGWSQQVRAFAGNRWWVLILPLAFTLLMLASAFVLRARRDLGAGIIADRPGPATGRLHGVEGLAVRLQLRLFLAWCVAFVVFGFFLGSLSTTLTGVLRSPAAADFITTLGGTGALTDAFLSAMVSILGFIAAAYGVSAASRLRAEEASGHLEHLMGTATTRTRWASSHFITALAGVALLMLVAGLSVGAGAAVSMHDGGQFARVVLTAITQIPAAWVITSVVVLAFGWVPRATAAVWGLLAFCLVLGEFGPLWKVPQWLIDLSPFQHTPRVPVDAAALGPVIVLLVVAAVVAIVGYVGWRRRDMTS